MKTAIYKSVVRVWYAVARVNIGCIKKGSNIHGLYHTDRTQCALRVSDWCANEGVPRRKIAIKTGFLPGDVTNHAVYCWRHDWLSDTKWLKAHRLI